MQVFIRAKIHPDLCKRDLKCRNMIMANSQLAYQRNNEVSDIYDGFLLCSCQYAGNTSVNANKHISLCKYY